MHDSVEFCRCPFLHEQSTLPIVVKLLRQNGLLNNSCKKMQSSSYVKCQTRHTSLSLPVVAGKQTCYASQPPDLTRLCTKNVASRLSTCYCPRRQCTLMPELAPDGVVGSMEPNDTILRQSWHVRSKPCCLDQTHTSYQ